MRKIRISLDTTQFERLVEGEEIVQHVKPLTGLITERRVNEMFDVCITLSDISFQAMKDAVLRAVVKKRIGKI